MANTLSTRSEGLENYVRQLSEGDGYYQLRPAISICVLDRVLFRDMPDHHLSFRLRCDQHDLVFHDDLVFHTLELPKCRFDRHNVGRLGPLERWVYFLQYAEHLEAEEISQLLVDDEFREAAGVLKMISQSPEDRQFYEARMKFLHDAQARLIAAREEGLQAGIEKGRAEGRQEGRQEGREEGRREGVAGMIRLLQGLLGEDLADRNDLLLLSSRELEQLAEELQRRMRQRGG